MKSLTGDGYQIEFDEQGGRVRMCGSLRLGGLAEYAPLAQLLDEALVGRQALQVDLAELEFLNSSGIATLSKFVINARSRKECELTIRGSEEVPWQGKSLNNLKRLMPALALRFD